MIEKSIPLPKTKTVRCFICREPIHDWQDYHAGRIKGEGLAYCHAECFAKEAGHRD